MISDFSIIFRDNDLEHEPIVVFGQDTSNSIVICKGMEIDRQISTGFSIQIPVAEAKKLVKALAEEIGILERVMEIKGATPNAVAEGKC